MWWNKCLQSNLSLAETLLSMLTTDSSDVSIDTPAGQLLDEESQISTTIIALIAVIAVLVFALLVSAFFVWRARSARRRDEDNANGDTRMSKRDEQTEHIYDSIDTGGVRIVNDEQFEPGLPSPEQLAAKDAVVIYSDLDEIEAAFQDQKYADVPPVHAVAALSAGDSSED